MKLILFFMLVTASPVGISQEKKYWTEDDRRFLLENLQKTKDDIIAETKGLTEAQWDFKEEPGRWSIRQITEHIAFWELILQREISQGLYFGKRPELLDSMPPDSEVIRFITEETAHISNEYTEPFTFSQPMGLNKGADNVAWFAKMRSESISYLLSAKEDLRLYFTLSKGNSIHQRFIVTYGHSWRHLRQIRKVKADPRFPR